METALEDGRLEEAERLRDLFRALRHSAQQGGGLAGPGAAAAAAALDGLGQQQQSVSSDVSDVFDA